MVRKEELQPFDIQFNSKPNSPELKLSQKYIYPWADSLTAQPSGIKILDLASGQGIEARQLAERGFDVVAQDVSPEMLSSSYYDGPKIAGTAEKLPFRDSEFSGILLKDALVFMSPTSRTEMLSEAYRTLIPNGSMLVVSEITRMRVWKQDQPNHLAYKDTYPTNDNWEEILAECLKVHDFSLVFATDPDDFSHMARVAGFLPKIHSRHTFESPLYKEKRWKGGDGGFVVELKK